MIDAATSIIAGGNRALYEHLFKNYRKEVRPIDYKNPSPTNVTVQLFIKQIQKVEESDQILTLYCWLEMYWTDVYLRWNASEFNGTTEIIVPAKSIWKPDLLVYNNANMNIEDNELETNAVIKSNGRVSVYRAMVTQITCLLRMESFPFDQQICFIMLSSWSYDGSGIMLDTIVPVDVDNGQTELSKVSTLTHYMPSAEWYLNDFKVQRNLKYYECCPYAFPDLTYYFSIRRNPIYYLFTQLVPSTFITVVTMIGSFTPHSSTGENEEKITLGITALLSLAIILMMVADKLPATSNDLPLLGKFYVGLIFIMFLATCCTTIVLSVQMRGNVKEEVPEWLRRAVRQNRILRIFFKHFHKRQKGGCACLMRSHSNSFLAKADDDCKLFAPPNPLYEASPVYHKILLAVNEIRSAARAAADRIDSDRRTNAIRKEWEFVARGLDRMFLTIFLTITLTYSFWLFNRSNDPSLMITDSFMNHTSSWA